MVNVNYMCSWGEHSSYFFSRISSLRHRDILTDVTITCEDKQFKAHRLVLCASSEYFRKILAYSTDKAAFIHMMNVSPVFIQNILQYVYTGQIEIAPADIEPFLKVANELKICGLSKEESNPEPKTNLPDPGHRLGNMSGLSDLRPGNLDSGGCRLNFGDSQPPLFVKDHFMSNLSQYMKVQEHERAKTEPRYDIDTNESLSNSFSNSDPEEQITIVPDIVDMSESYDSIREEKENVEQKDTVDLKGEERVENEEAQTVDISTSKKSPTTFSIVKSLAVDPSVSKRRGSSDDEGGETKRGKIDLTPLPRLSNGVGGKTGDTKQAPYSTLANPMPPLHTLIPPVPQTINSPLNQSINSPLSSPSNFLRTTTAVDSPTTPSGFNNVGTSSAMQMLNTPIPKSVLQLAKTNAPPPKSDSQATRTVSPLSGLYVPYLTSVAPAGIGSVNCKKGHSGLHCPHVIVTERSGRKLHYHRHEYQRWLDMKHKQK